MGRAAVVGAALVLVGVLPACGQERLMDALIGETTAVFGEEGFAPFDSRRAGGLGLGGVAREEIDLQAGTTYGIVGVCDVNCADLDLRLLDPDGTGVSEDDAGDDGPVLLVTPERSGAFTVAVSMVRCAAASCGWAVQVYADGAPERAVESGEAAQRHEGDLAAGDERYPTGEFFDAYALDASAGETLFADLRSEDFDTYLALESPSGAVLTNDDHEGDTDRSRLQVAVTETGRWTARVTSFEPGSTGRYTLLLDARVPEVRDLLDLPVEGSLARGGQRLKDGRYSDTHVFQGTAGDRVTVDLRAAGGFDSVLMLFAPGGALVEENDDYEGSRDHSRIQVELESTGEHRVVVTSYEAGEVGAYELSVVAEVAAPEARPQARREQGRLEPGDAETRGRYVDEYAVEWRQGERHAVDLRGDFDTYLEVTGPGLRRQNDDVDEVGHSAVEAIAPETGTYRVLVSSYGEGESGAYELSIERIADPDRPGVEQDVERLRMGETRSGRLEEGDAETETGRYHDSWVVDGRAGRMLSVDLESDDFDTVLHLISPDGEALAENDDADGSDDTNSRIVARLPASGRYRVRATSYGAGEVGAYRVRVGAAPDAAPSPSSAQTYGVFVGVGDYAGRLGDLPYTADDPHRILDGLLERTGMPADNAVVLTDEEATLANVRAAFEALRERVGPRDTFVFFFSGHGDRVEQPAGSRPESSDPDGLDETIELVDGALRDNELDELLDGIDSELVLVVLDSCFSGGFSKDVISVPGRIGFFSSEEDVTSLVANKFAAGGYLSLFFAEALGERGADEDGDREITSRELRGYLHGRYRSPEEKSGEDYIRALDFTQQHLVVDSGSVRWSDVLFRLP